MAYLRSVFPGQFSAHSAACRRAQQSAGGAAAIRGLGVRQRDRVCARARAHCIAAPGNSRDTNRRFPGREIIWRWTPRRSAPCWCATPPGRCMRFATAVRMRRTRWWRAAAAGSTGAIECAIHGLRFALGRPARRGRRRRRGSDASLELRTHRRPAVREVRANRRAARRGRRRAHGSTASRCTA